MLWISVLTGVLLLAIGAGTLLVVRPGPVREWLAGPLPSPSAPPPSPEPTPGPVLAAAPSDGAGPTPRGVRAAVHGLIVGGDLGRVNVSIVDVATGTPLYAANEDRLTVPASTTKLVTAATVLAARGPAYRIVTRAVAGRRPGEVVIVGAGDPTLAVNGRSTYPGVARLDRLAAQVKKALGGVAPTRVVIDGTLFSGPTSGPAWDGDIVRVGHSARITALMANGGRIEPEDRELAPDPRFAEPDRAAGQAFAGLLGLPRSAVVHGRAPAAPPTGRDAGPSAGADARPSAASPAEPPASPAESPASPAAGASAEPQGAAPIPGAELGRVVSPPMLRLVEWMLEESDNTIAEALARQVALAEGEPASFTGAAEAMDAVVARLGLPADETDVRDGSGLSRRNKVTPSLLTDLLALASGGDRPELAGLFGGLPVAGWSGTLEPRFATPAPNRAGRGLVRAKTGSLAGVHALSGVVATKDGRLLAFAILADGVSTSADAARAQLDRIAARLTACGCR